MRGFCGFLVSCLVNDCKKWSEKRQERRQQKVSILYSLFLFDVYKNTVLKCFPLSHIDTNVNFILFNDIFHCL